LSALYEIINTDESSAREMMFGSRFGWKASSFLHMSFRESSRNTHLQSESASAAAAAAAASQQLPHGEAYVLNLDGVNQLADLKGLMQ
jgi:hypothetical protein